jgi:DNA (cytosine-5)-methyltransferase 1
MRVTRQAHRSGGTLVTARPGSVKRNFAAGQPSSLSEPAIADEFTFYEFFAGCGMARAGLGRRWTCLLANDKEELKTTAYAGRWGSEHLDKRDVKLLTTADLAPGGDLAWASFPCQDLSVAGHLRGIGSASSSRTRSGALWPFLQLVADLRGVDREPTLIVLENVLGLLTSNRGRDFAKILRSLKRSGYTYGAFVIDARHFLPQSRPRVFIVAVRERATVPVNLVRPEPEAPWHNAQVLRAWSELPKDVAAGWTWWSLGDAPELPDGALANAIDLSDGARWHPREETTRLLAMMAPAHAARLKAAKREGKVRIGSLYLRMRPEHGVNVQRAEISFGATLGCLRTPRGGGSRPRIIVVEGNRVRTRLLSAMEAAGLMGLDKGYKLPASYEHAFRLIGDGVAPPVVRFLADRLLEPLALAGRRVDVQRRRWRL